MTGMNIKEMLYQKAEKEQEAFQKRMLAGSGSDILDDAGAYTAWEQFLMSMQDTDGQAETQPRKPRKAGREAVSV